ncbi:hypothetical protein F5Y12DRAFT_709800 [Xylaria sp. FL1777]|nr:hypothetical protein F5Y12DRAFT_709800 [Xylaria sp. FL1777]
MQPWPPPGNQSRYFRSGIGDGSVSQNQGRLFPLLPHTSRSPGAIAAPKSPMPPLLLRQQPHPFFASGPAATGYIPQQSARYYRNSGLQQPIIPLREEFSTVNNIRGVDGPMALEGLGQVRPYSVPSSYMQTSQPNYEHSAQEIPRPASVTYKSTQTPLDLNRPAMQPLHEGEKLGFPPPKRGVPEDQCFEDDFIPPKRILPFPTKKGAKTQMVHSETQRETMTIESPSSKRVPTNTKQVHQCTTEEPTSSRVTAKKVEASASQSQSSNKRANSKENMPKRLANPDSTSADNFRSSKRPKIKFTNCHALQREHNTSMSTSVTAHMSKGTSQEPRPRRISSENSQGGSINGTVGSITDNASVGVSMCEAYAALPREENLSHPHPIEADGDLECEKTLSISALEDSHSAMITPSLSKPKASKQPLLGTASINGNEDITEVKASSNPMVMIDEMMVLQQEISEIVSTRLQQGNADLLDALHAGCYDHETEVTMRENILGK